MAEPTCINLVEAFGGRYRIGWEADGEPSRSGRGRTGRGSCG
jgi:hypothetical protein